MALAGCVDLGTEGVWGAFQSRCHCLLSNFFTLDIIETGFTVTLARHAVKPGRKTLAVELEALRISAITSLSWRNLSEQHTLALNFGLFIYPLFARALTFAGNQTGNRFSANLRNYLRRELLVLLLVFMGKVVLQGLSSERRTHMKASKVHVGVLDNLNSGSDIIQRVKLDLRPIKEVHDAWFIKFGDDARFHRHVLGSLLWSLGLEELIGDWDRSGLLGLIGQ